MPHNIYKKLWMCVCIYIYIVTQLIITKDMVIESNC